MSAMEGVGRALIGWLPGMLLATALMLAVALAGDRLLGRRVAASIRLWLYVAVAARVALPAGWSPLGVLGRRAPVGQVISDGPVLATAGGAVGSAGVAPLELVLGIIYLAGVLVLLGRWGWSRLALARALRAAGPVSAEAATVRGAMLVQHPTLGPLVAGLWRPRVVLPAPLLTQADPEMLRFVLGHEVAHVQRRDHLLLAALQLVCMLAWPVAPLWVAFARIRQLIELAADERALEGAPLAVRRRYGEVLLALAEDPPVRPMAVVPAFGFGLRVRLKALTLPRRWPRAAQRGLVAVIAGVLFACAGEPPPPEPAPTATAPAAAPSGPLVGVPAHGSVTIDGRAVALADFEEALRKALAATGANAYRVVAAPDAPAEKVRLVMSLARAAGGRSVDLAQDGKSLQEPRTSDNTPDIIPGAATVRGSLDKDVIRRVIRRHINEVKYCYEASLKNKPGLAGRVMVQFTISGSGEVITSVLQSSTMGDPAAESCIAKAPRRWQFPRPEGGGIVIVSYPFVLTPGSE